MHIKVQIPTQICMPTQKGYSAYMTRLLNAKCVHVTAGLDPYTVQTVIYDANKLT